MAKIPFGLLPGSWGLTGKTRRKAEAEYYYSGYELEVELSKIDIEDKKELELKLLDIDFKYKKIDEYEYDIKKAKLGDNIELALLDVELKHKKINQLDYDKKRADILKEPWVSMPIITWDPSSKNKAFFQIDYNEYFIEDLKKEGYTGKEDDMIDRWLNDLCISIIEELNQQIEPEFITPTRRFKLSDKE